MKRAKTRKASLWHLSFWYRTGESDWHKFSRLILGDVSSIGIKACLSYGNYAIKPKVVIDLQGVNSLSEVWLRRFGEKDHLKSVVWIPTIMGGLT